MLYVLFSNEYHYHNDRKIYEAVCPVLNTVDGHRRVIPNGVYDNSLNVSLFADENRILIDSAKDSDKDVWILAQSITVPWSNRHNKNYGSKKGNVTLLRTGDEKDIVIWKLEEGSWFVSGETIYHNRNGVLIKYSLDSVIGWETWGTIPQNFIYTCAVGLSSKDNASSMDITGNRIDL